MVTLPILSLVFIWIAGVFIGIGLGIAVNKNTIKMRLKDRKINTSKFNDLL